MFGLVDIGQWVQEQNIAAKGMEYQTVIFIILKTSFYDLTVIDLSCTCETQLISKFRVNEVK